MSVWLPDPNPPQSGSSLQATIGLAYLCVPSAPLLWAWPKAGKLHAFQATAFLLLTAHMVLNVGA